MLSEAYYPKIVKEDEETNTIDNSVSKPIQQPIQLTINVINSIGVSGSASYFHPGSSKIICAVVGPYLGTSSSGTATGIESGTFECDVSFAPFMAENDIFNNHSGKMSLHESRISQLVKDALQSSLKLELYPKALIKLHIVILQSSKNDVSGCINCASLALADASVELNDLVSSFSYTKAIRNSGTDGGKDGNSGCKEQANNMTLSYMSYSNCISHIDLSGRLDAKERIEYMNVCKSGCDMVRSMMNDQLRNKLLRFTPDI
jgi:exosome complex component MTR3